MAKSKKTQVLTLSLIATLISLIPFLSSSLRSTYLYFIINVLILVLGVESGFLSSSSTSTSSNLKKTPNNTKVSSSTSARITRVQVEEDSDVKREKTNKIVVCGDEVKKMIKKCPSTQSMFFIGGNESEAKVEEKEVRNENEEEEEEEGEGGQGVFEEEELFEKAETFIDNFYKQLKMQREESWNQIHEFKENGVFVN